MRLVSLLGRVGCYPGCNCVLPRTPAHPTRPRPPPPPTSPPLLHHVQPAEEGPGGALPMVKEGCMEGVTDGVFGSVLPSLRGVLLYRGG